ncbi:MurR/RpiR family transcriptional regulator [Geobacillus stearothermophilus]|uniref:MurR/RpiR family transcriptional regulator n=1 Tax=Geobacillus stearothermophilus TaxID=1422 RepID=UPI0006AC26F1|nr:MurR/RpiR family transcriptional regulator [Geobacillus stearothermophilus]KOR94769.1 regulator [Geobacillus stearothermophilus ATCC 12980]MED4358878.1 MurR/RpiR family transcriptional regulator [Geobacillus stearothermophilus]MED4879897.1 MurR/RpiR family transcriptional regulator [Geobacillus stearothermophilus]MED5010328.1 MurR/RpiR family transcriptional regulator [Geobacillus stearothermophilus]MED5012866.1 MurR/RpiR family transcriptional regulator [Geobacillus stearothermophilus]
MGKLLDRFSNYIGQLTHAEKHVLYYIDGHVEQAKQLSLTAMAKKNNVSTTTIIRMCHKLGLEGFSELKYILKTIDDQAIPVGENTIERYKADMNQTLDSLERKHAEEISQLIFEANRVLIVAVGLSKMIGEYFSKLLIQVNKPSSYVYESHIIDLLPNMVQPKDMVIFISSSGETKTIVQAAEKLRFKNIETVAITNSADSTLAKLVRKHISAYVQRVQFAGYDLSARSTLVVLIDILFEFFMKNYKA